MAASGIAEHAEARRRQNVINRRAYHIKSMIDDLRDHPNMYDPPAQRPQTTYEQEMCSPSYQMRKVGSPPGIGNHQAPIIDKLRRQQMLEQQMVEYSAKLPNRLSSTNYTQQW